MNKVKGQVFGKGINEPSLVGKIPCNCKTPCVYGIGRPFCFPCMKVVKGEDRRDAA